MGLSNLFNKLRDNISHPLLSFGILKPCRRCVYGKRRERVFIVSGGGYGDRMGEVLVIVDNATGKVYRRVRPCLKADKCARCISGVEMLPCDFEEV